MYRVEISKAAQRQLKKLANDLRVTLSDTINELAISPRPIGVTKLMGRDDVYRMRQGEYRILYEIHDDVLVVLVFKVGHRREVYRG